MRHANLSYTTEDFPTHSLCIPGLRSETWGTQIVVNHVGYLSARASTPGSFLPSRNSRLAPPPVEMWVIWSATPAWLMALTESPPPMIEVAALLAATARAMALVPLAKLGNSKTPAGPFQTMVRAREITSSIAATDLGPMSRPCQSAGKSVEVSQG